MYIGIDLGGTKTEIICLDHQGDEIYRHRVNSPQNSYTETLSTLTNLVLAAEQAVDQSGSVGLAMPGSICRETHTVKNSNSTWINGRHIQSDLEKALQRPIKVENDANCFVLSESNGGAASQAKTVFGAILGTGCGGGLVMNGELVIGGNGLAGEWGHNPLPFPRVWLNEPSAYHSVVNFFDGLGAVEQSAIYAEKKTINYFVDTPNLAEYPGPLCYCGKRGCLETWISGTGFSQDYQRTVGGRLSAQVIVDMARKGDSIAQTCFERYCERLAKSFAQLINIIDPDVIVCGGGMSNVKEIYAEVPERWDRYIFSTASPTTTLVAAQFGDSSGVRGAALLWKNG